MTAAPESTRLIAEYRITDWVAEKTPAEFLVHQDAWYDQRRYFELDDAVFELMTRRNAKVGGVPNWTGNGPDGFPESPFEYLGQFGTLIHCDGPAPSADEAGTTIRYNRANADGSARYEEPKKRIGEALYLLQVDNKDGFYGDWANLGSDGEGLLFIDRTTAPVQVVWFWNR